MKIVVIGDGKVGATIVEHTAKENHRVTIIDNDPKVVEQMVNKFDVMGICGYGASYETQKEAGVDKADIVIATTSSDEINILSCVVAKSLGAKSTIARVRNYEYSTQIDLMRENLGIDMIINPELEAANEIKNIINFPEALKVDSFGNEQLDLVELYIDENNLLVGETLSSLFIKYHVFLLVCAVQRGEEVFIPSGNFVLQAKDRIHLVASRANIRLFLEEVGFNQRKIRDVLIIGGGKISLYLASNLIKNKYRVKIIEKDYNKCLELSDLLPKATIIHGDGAEQSLLLEEGINDIDAIVSLTGSDEENIIISMFAHKQNAHKVIAKINKSTLVGILETVGVASVISPKEITSSKILGYVRATNNRRGNNVERLYKLVNNKIEAVQFIANKNSRLTNAPLKDLKLKENILIAAIIRNGESIIPSGSTTIQLGDSVIVVSKDYTLYELKDIME